METLNKNLTTLFPFVIYVFHLISNEIVETRFMEVTMATLSAPFSTGYLSEPINLFQNFIVSLSFSLTIIADYWQSVLKLGASSKEDKVLQRDKGNFTN